MRAQSLRQRASRLGRDSMGRPVWNRTYSAVIPCIVFACSHLPHHRISTAQKGHGCPFSTRALVFYHTLLENATSFSKKVRANSRKSELFSGNRFWKNLTTRCSGFPRLTRRAAGRPPRQSPANRRVNARSSPGRGLPEITRSLPGRGLSEIVRSLPTRGLPGNRAFVARLQTAGQQQSFCGKRAADRTSRGLPGNRAFVVRSTAMYTIYK